MWDKITVGQFQQLYDILIGQNFDHEFERQIKLLSCLDDRPVDYYEALPIGELKRECARTAFLSLEDMPVVKAPNELVIDGRRFRVIYEFNQLCAGQFIDVMTCAKNTEEHVLNLDKTLAAICLPMNGKKVGKYGDVPFSEVADLMLKVPIVHAQAIALFFYRAWDHFLKVIPGYLEKKRKKGKQLTEMEAIVQDLALTIDGVG